MEQFIQKPPRTKACYILNLPGLSPALKSWHVFNGDAERKNKISGAIWTGGKQFESTKENAETLESTEKAMNQQ